MSKFVVIVDDENYTCPLEHEGHCHIALNKYYKCMEDCDGILNNRPEFCPLKEYKEAIPIELIKKKLLSCQYEYENDYDKGFDNGWNCVIKTLLKNWEEENER